MQIYVTFADQPDDTETFSRQLNYMSKILVIQPKAVELIHFLLFDLQVQ